MYIKYTKDLLAPLVSKAASFNELARLVGIAPTGSNTVNLKRRCLDYGFDLSHMTGRCHNKNISPKNKKEYSCYLVEGSPTDRRLETRTLRRAMVESGIPYECGSEHCSIVDKWNGNPLKLHIDHIDGRHWNNRKENLRFLCPNCHSQTETWGRH